MFEKFSESLLDRQSYLWIIVPRIGGLHAIRIVYSDVTRRRLLGPRAEQVNKPCFLENFVDFKIGIAGVGLTRGVHALPDPDRRADPILTFCGPSARRGRVCWFVLS